MCSKCPPLACRNYYWVRRTSARATVAKVSTGTAAHDVYISSCHVSGVGGFLRYITSFRDPHKQKSGERWGYSTLLFVLSIDVVGFPRGSFWRLGGSVVVCLTCTLFCRVLWWPCELFQHRSRRGGTRCSARSPRSLLVHILHCTIGLRFIMNACNCYRVAGSLANSRRH
jgi:hypothetical protein